MPPERVVGERKVSAYFQATKWLRRGVRLAGGLSSGFWLGVLSDSELDAIDTRYYDQRSSYRDSAYNGRGLFEWETKVVDDHFGECSRVVVTAAGGGREVLALRERGFDALGFECHPALVTSGRALLKARGHDGSLHPCARDAWPTAERFDGAVVGWGSYMLIRGRGRRVEFLRGAAASLPTGAPILLSFFGRERLGFEHRLTATLANAIRTLRRRERLDAGDTLVPNFVHLFTEGEVSEELRAGGFELVAFERNPYPHVVAFRR